ncbi:hypothetical protein T552_03119 [Pneumocystis carinii B80]|uniref:Uncharacterized protein n=1 Tax=Pneumocystis carinii (strain B80) TaxID=1408658 RepID=A0A0W4ZBR1_PNEC8|nr:hypothetical protein T552_03119 [Pneumocystis carinii B80]KTW25846.1 hypothetical protein T552_03119 [Pneumocystis carinii B80]
MSNTRKANALYRLVSYYISRQPDDPQSLENFENILLICEKILDASIYTCKNYDIVIVSDAIKKKLLRENSTSDNAIRFINLFSRLQCQDILVKKAEILQFLYSICDSSYIPAKVENVKNSFSRMNFYEDTTDSESFFSAISSNFTTALSSSRPKNSTPRSLLLKAPLIVSQNYDASESTLLKDISFILQGISSSSVRFSNEGSATISPKLPFTVASLLCHIVELGLLYKQLFTFISFSHNIKKSIGLIKQSFFSCLDQELSAYLNLVSTLEVEIRKDLLLPDDQLKMRSVTLKRIIIWTREASMALRLMALMVENCKNLKGGQLINCILEFSSHGDPFVHEFSEKLIESLRKPFYDMLIKWIYDGELLDPFQEFFVVDKGIDTKLKLQSSINIVWEGKYVLDLNMLPNFISENLARKVFLIGKSLNFIRHGCDDDEWVQQHSKASMKDLIYGDIDFLEHSIDAAYLTTSSRLIGLMSTRFSFFDHLNALKKYLLLGQGDFIAFLMESLSLTLDKPANMLYRHNLTATLESAIRESNAQFDSPDIIRRLDARMLERSHGEIGWDIFTLEYKVDSPVDVIVTPRCTRQYLKVFNFLWRLKRVEFALSNSWKKSITGEREILRHMQGPLYRQWQRVRCANAEMIHFICQLQYYILFEVIESSWDVFYSSISKSDCTLDTLIEAHAQYTMNITHKGLLGSGKIGKEGSLLSQLHEILKIILFFKETLDHFYTYSLTEYIQKYHTTFKAKSETKDHINKDLNLDSLNTKTPDDPGLIIEKLNSLAKEFHTHVIMFLGDLVYQSDSEMRFLGVRLNYNEYYHVSKKHIK